jgi:hypothetical protein
MSAELEIKVGKPVILGDSYGWFPQTRIWSDGTIVVGATTDTHDVISGALLLKYYNHIRNGGGFTDEELSREGLNDIHLGKGYWAIQSKDGGRIWEKVTDDLYRTLIGWGNIYELRNGTLLANSVFGYNTENGLEFIIWKSADHGKTWSKPQFVPVSSPLSSDSYDDSIVLAGTVYGNLVELEDGTIMLFGSTRFQNVNGFGRTRSVVYRSVDNAGSFHYYATVACGMGHGEPYGIRLENGEILCFMRSTEYEPMYLSRSANDGATWSEPVRVGVDGILPTCVKMSNGVLALSYGAPGIWVTFNADGTGRKWTDKTCIWLWNSLIEQGHTPQARHYKYRIPERLLPPASEKHKASSYRGGCRSLERSDCNPRICEISPGRLLVVYNAPTNVEDERIFNPMDADQRKHFSIWGVTIDVSFQ